MTEFVHLHVHTQYSLLDGQASIRGLVDKALADGMPALAVTDHGNMFGIKEFLNYVAKATTGRKKQAAEAEKRATEARQAGDEAAAAKAEAERQALLRPFKPIVGCEMYVALRDRRENVDKRDTGRHLVVLAKNKQGYKNLIKLVSRAWTEGFYMHPRTDLESLERYHEGLIVCSACLGGQLPRLIQEGRLDEAREHAAWFKRVFGDDYYIELQRHPGGKPGGNTEVYDVQQRVNPVLIDIARELGIKLVATNDVHFVNEEDAEAHDRLICVSTNTPLTDAKRMRYTKQEWMKTTAEMAALFADLPKALANTVEVADKVEVYSIDHAPIMPMFDIPADFGTEEQWRERFTDKDIFNEFTRDENGKEVLTPEEAQSKIDKLGGIDRLYRIKLEADYLAKLTYEGAERRYGKLTDELRERLNFELHIMKTMGFPGYFLIVQDFITAAREKLDVSVGPGRGSAAGSCVAYCLGITQIDPIRYDLLFERFLNPDRISLPDIDIDFDDDGRDDVLRYVTEKYGAEKVAHIITYGTMAAKSAIKDVARIEQLPLSESDRLSKLIPKRMPEVNGKELKPTLENCFRYVPEFKPELASSNPLVVETLEYARRLEGNVRNVGVHACGVIICRDDITDWVPVSTAIDKNAGAKTKGEKMIVTQYEGSVIEDTGLIKMDFLGLKTLSIIKEAVRNIKLTTGRDIDIDTVDIEDPKTYALYCEGHTVGTFQFESAGMQKYLRELQPSTFEDLIAMNALYRPGPMDYIPEFIARKHGRAPIVYDIPQMEQYLKDTYGVTVYQEQVMLLSRLLAGFTRGQSDTLRKAMGKKMIDKMQALKALFLEGGKERGHNVEVLEKVWADWEKFASYAFNKSHATCYSWVAFQTAWLKANYPSEYMAAVLSRNRDDTTKLTVFMDECRRMRIPVKGPDINESFMDFGVNSRGDIRFGLAAIKGVGETVVSKIIAARAVEPFRDIYDFVERVPAGVINRRVFDSLAQAGAFDCFRGVKREDYVEVNNKGETLSEQLLRYGSAFQNDKQEAAMSLFAEDLAASAISGRPEIVPAPAWVDAVRLERERELVGMYLSAHPLDPYYFTLNYGVSHTIKQLNEDPVPERTDLTFGGMVVSLDTRMGKNGRWGILKIEDFTGSLELRLFSKDYLQFHNYGVPGTPVLLRVQMDRRFADSDPMLTIKQIQLLSDVSKGARETVTLHLDAENANSRTLDILRGSFKPSGSDNARPLKIVLNDRSIGRHLKFDSAQWIDISRPTLRLLEEEEIPITVNSN